MAGIIVQLLVSWLIIWLIDKKGLGVLGLYPRKERLGDFGLFFLVTTVFCASGFIGRMVLLEERWEFNPALSLNLVLSGFWWMIKSVLFEELIFRGVLLYILLRRLGMRKAILISAVAFGIYHWFSFGVFGNPVQMVYVFFLTGLAGLVYAYGYTKTLSLYVPIAIHLAWNFTQGFIFSQGPIGNGILVPESPSPRTDSYFIYFFIAFFPAIAAFGVSYWLLRRKRPATI